MRRSTVALLVLALVVAMGPAAFAQTLDLTPLYGEFGVLFDELGKDTLSHVQQFGLTMDGVGRAEVGKGVFVSVSGGGVFTPGIATFRPPKPSPFSYLGAVFDGLETTISATPGLVATLYEATKTSFIDPGLRLSAGLALANGLEIWGHVGTVPQLAADAVGKLAGMEGIVLNRMNAGGRVRMVLVHDQKGLPAVSIGGGYTYTQFNLGVSLGALPLGDSLALVPGFTAELAGDLYARTRLHTAGVELAVSKKLLFIVPFLRLGAWYQWASYAAGIGEDGVGELEVTLSGLGTPFTVAGNLEPTVQQIHDLSFVVGGGLELVFGKLSLIFQGSFDTASATPALGGTFQLRI